MGDAILQSSAPAVDMAAPAVDMAAPLKGVVLCCTAIPPEDRALLAKHAEQMGAKHRYDLTSEVTHLLTGDYNTPKYRYVAKERPDIKVLEPEWIEAIRQLWMDDEAINLQELEDQYTLPIFKTLRICMTGFEDPERTNIINTVRDNGGTYSGDLTKTITHLIAREPKGNKYKFGKQWNLRLVSAEWLYESIERGMILEEKYYHPELPLERRGKDEKGENAWKRERATPAKREREEDEDGGTRKLRRTLSTKLMSVNESIWGDIVGLASNSNANPVTNPVTNQPLQRTASIANTTQASSLATLSGLDDATPILEPETKKGAFTNCRIYVHGFPSKRSETMRQHLVSEDAMVCATMDLLSMQSTPQTKNFVIVPHQTPPSELPTVLKDVPIVTEWWVERCLEAKTCLAPSAEKFDLPFPHLKVNGFEDAVVSSSGFKGYELLHLCKIVALMGGTYSEFFTRKSTVLICNMERQRHIRQEKLSTAEAWGVPVVDVKWLAASIEAGKRVAYEEYKLPTSRPHHRPATVQVRKSFATEGGDSFRDEDLAPTLPIEKARRPDRRVPAPRDKTAFEDDEDDDGETLNSMYRRKSKGGSSGAPAAPAADDDQPPLEDDGDDEGLPPPPEDEDDDLDTLPTAKRPTSPSSKPAHHTSDETQTTSEDTQTLAPKISAETRQTITSLLTRPKHDAPAPNTSRNPRKILGRAQSNLSAPSSASGSPKAASFSRTASNGSLGTMSNGVNGSGTNPANPSNHGNHAHPSRSGTLKKTTSAGSVVEQLLLDEVTSQNPDPSQTQRIRYVDEEAEREREGVLDRMRGKLEKTAGGGRKKGMEREVTIGSLAGGRGVRSVKKRMGGEGEGEY